MDINNLDQYKDFIKDFMYWFNPLKTEQLELALCKYFKDVDTADAKEIISRCQSKRYVLTSPDGWAMTRGVYVQLTGDSKYEYMKASSENMLPVMNNFVINSCNTERLNCLWVLIDMLPASMDFVVTHKPFQLSFTNKNNILYECIYISSENESAKVEMLNLLPRDLFEDAKSAIRRIVIMENPNNAIKIPKGIGVRYILAIDDSKKTHYRVVEKRENIWDE